MVLCHCNQLRVLDLKGLKQITGMFALCDGPEPTLSFRTLCFMIFLEQVHTDHNVPPLDYIVSRYNKAHTFKTLFLILHCIACCSQIHPIIIIIIIIVIHIFKDLDSEPLCSISQYGIFLIGLTVLIFPCGIKLRFFIVIFFYNFKHLTTF